MGYFLQNLFKSQNVMLIPLNDLTLFSATLTKLNFFEINYLFEFI